ncbi:hypothetical protein Forpi1262_v005162 [Fusarium oxysporum f. sp. raphani]|uniref:Uncharacterized protein n=1 Tax=Fusarium oxysporum f. sp. raphani TaxID=96318 RepID=A0A8J5QC64_FUSOX|nr:hypothetical protein Forpi1262_v005162 [Fusarium oxysporum f. sp. raphani]
MRNKHWVTISSREKDTVNRKGNVTRHTSFFKKTLTQIQTAMIRTIHFQCRLDEHDGPQPPFGPPPSPIKHQCRNLEPLFPLIANHLQKKDISAASCLHSASLHMNTVEQQRIEQADDKAVDMLYQAYAQIRAPPAVAPQALVAHPQ